MRASAASEGAETFDVVLIPLGSAGYGGAERSLLDIAGKMHGRGLRVLILAEQALRPTPFETAATERGVAVRWVDWAPERGLFPNLLAIVRAFRQIRPRIVHFNISWRERMWLVPLVVRLLGRGKLIGTMRAIPDPAERIERKRYLFGLIPGIQLWRLPDVLAGHVWARALHASVSVNRGNYPPRMVAEYGFREESLHVIYNGIEVPDVLPDAAARAAVRSSFGFTDDDFIVCYFGRVSPEKGVHLLLQSLVALPAHVRALIIGDGPQMDELKTFVVQSGLGARVRFAGFVAKPEPMVAACDVAAVPSTWEEAFGRTVVEALAYEVPVIATRVGGMAELFQDGVHGHYVEAGDVPALGNSIRDLERDRVRAQMMGREGRRWVQAHYAVTRVAEQYAGIYADALGTPLPGSIVPVSKHPR
ncbi:MAG: glycosyltransferase family 4 protein [Burkholderiales bacterium]|nr:glycosyltransferase family 4 protein [Burkholderiales bacterium]